VLRALPKGMLFGTFFDVPNLMEVAAWFAGLQPSKLAPRQSVLPELAPVAWAVGAPEVKPRRRGRATGHGSRGSRRGIRSPGRTGRRRSETSDDVTDRFDGKSLEGGSLDDPARTPMPETVTR